MEAVNVQTSKQKEYCPTCGHVIAKERANLSSLEFRRLIHNIRFRRTYQQEKSYIPVYQIIL